LGHAVHCAKELVGGEPFVVMLGDEIYPTEPCLPKLIETYEKYKRSVLTLFSVPREQIPSYGIASVKALGHDVLRVNDLVEKPPIEEAPSDLAVAGRYLMTPDIFEILEKTPPGRGGEIQVTDALQIQAQQGRCYGIHFAGERYDTGSPLGLLTTSVAIGLKHPEIGGPLREALQQLLEAE
jgi:UTP--glucose-1-phosphate uridylyltransferase